MADRKAKKVGEVLPVLAAAGVLGLMLWWIAGLLVG